MSLPELAPWIAAAAAFVAVVVVGVLGARAWRDYRRIDRTWQAAVALVDVHRDRLDEAIDRATQGVGTVADGGEELAASIAALRDDVDQLRWLLARIPEERDRLRRELADLVLPGDG